MRATFRILSQIQVLFQFFVETNKITAFFVCSICHKPQVANGLDNVVLNSKILQLIELNNNEREE